MKLNLFAIGAVWLLLMGPFLRAQARPWARIGRRPARRTDAPKPY